MGAYLHCDACGASRKDGARVAQIEYRTDSCCYRLDLCTKCTGDVFFESLMRTRSFKQTKEEIAKWNS